MTVEAGVPVRVTSLSRRFGAVRAVDGVTFDVRRGEMFGLIGPDGAGKTTTLRMILGLLKPDAGEVRTLGLDPARERRGASPREAGGRRRSGVASGLVATDRSGR